MDQETDRRTENKTDSDKKQLVVSSKDVAQRGMSTIAFAIFIVIAAAIVMMFFTNTSSTKYYNEEQFKEFNEGWEFNLNGTKSNFSLPEEVTLAGGEEMTISKRLPLEVPEYSALVSRNYHMKIIVSVDGEELYRYPEEESGIFSRVLVDDWNVINLRPDMAGKVIEVKFVATRAGFSGYIRPVYFGIGDSIIRYLKEKYTLFFITGVSILIAGLVLLLLGLFYYKYDKSPLQPISGIMLLITGIWLTSRSKMPILGMGSTETFIACFLALTLVPLALAIYSMVRFPDKNQKITGALVFIDIVYFMVSTAALITKYTIQELALPAYIMMAINALYVVYNLWGYAFGKESLRRSKRDVLKDRIEVIASILMLIGFVIETVAYTDELMTEVNIINRIAFNIYAAGHVAKLIIDSYNGVKDRTAAISKLHESQVALLMGQIQPHFIFNTLSSIRTLIKVDPDTAYEMVYNFSNYLRANVDNISNMTGIKMAAEVEHIKSYVNIEKVRFGDRVNIEYDVQVKDFMVPPLSIQPIVENAIKHGICVRPEGGTVWIRSYPTEYYNVVEVEDDGVGFSPESLEAAFRGGREETIGGDQKLDAVVLEETISSSHLLDAKGNPITISHDLIEYGTGNLTGNGSENHVSSGIRNVILRLREMANARVEINSKEGEGTLFRVFFPIDG